MFFFFQNGLDILNFSVLQTLKLCPSCPSDLCLALRHTIILISTLIGLWFWPCLSIFISFDITYMMEWFDDVNFLHDGGMHVLEVYNNRSKYELRSVYTTDIERRPYNSYIIWSNGVVSHGAPVGGIRVFVNHTRGNKQIKCVHDLCVPCGISRMFIFTLRPWYIHTWRITVLIAAKKTWIPLILAPWWDKDGTGLGSSIYICGLH